MPDTYPHHPSSTTISDPAPRLGPLGSISLWLAAGYWLVNGVAHLLQLIPATPLLATLPAAMIVAAIVAAVVGVLSLWGAVMLVRRRKSAVPILVSVFAIEVLWFLVALLFVSAAGVSTSTLIGYAIACASIAYVLLLGKRGMLK